MAEVSNYKRRADLKAALRRVKPDDFLELEHVALLWGTTKQRFVTVRNAMADFPDPLPGQGNKYIYPARRAIEAMISYETRHDDAAKLKAARAQAIIGPRGKRAKDDLATASHSVNELATLARMRAEIEEQEREQGLYAPIAETAAVAGEVFELISDFMSTLDNKMDPHGLWEPEFRSQVRAAGADALLQLHAKMKAVLSPDAKPRSSRTSSRRPSRARARR